MKKLPGSCGPQEEVTQPGLPPEETFTDAPYDTPSQSLTEEQKWPSEWHQVCWMAAQGIGQTVIAKELQYTEKQVSVILNKRSVQDKIESIRREFLGTNQLEKKFASVAPKAAEYFAKIITGEEVVKSSERIDASKWMLEQVVGKAKQKVDVEGETTLLQVMRALDEQKEEKRARMAKGLPDIEVTATEETKPEDPFDNWISSNLGGKK